MRSNARMRTFRIPNDTELQTSCRHDGELEFGLEGGSSGPVIIPARSGLGTGWMGTWHRQQN